MNDPQIRAKLLRLLQAPTARVIEEFPVHWGYARVDIVRIGMPGFEAFEIKSAQDTLAGLHNQQRFYSTVFDFVTVVTEDKWALKVCKQTPRWWGVWVDDGKTDSEYDIVRPSTINPGVNKRALVELLWSKEIKELLEKHDIKCGNRVRRQELGEMLASRVDLCYIREDVQQILKSRVYTNPKRNQGRCSRHTG